MAAINHRECSNKYFGKEQLIIGIAAINNQVCGNYLLKLQQEYNIGNAAINSRERSKKYL